MTGLPGTVLERDGAAYRVMTGDGEVRAVLSGKTKRDTPRVVVGDRVTLIPDPVGGLYSINDVAERKTLLERRVPLGRGARPIAANIDTVFVVTSNMPASAEEDPLEYYYCYYNDYYYYDW